MIDDVVYLIHDKKVIDIVRQDAWDRIDNLSIVYAAYKIGTVDWVCAWYSNREEVLIYKTTH